MRVDTLTDGMSFVNDSNHSNGFSFDLSNLTSFPLFTFPNVASGVISLNPMTLTGDIVYGGTSGVETRLLGNTTTTKKFLTQTGNGSVSAAPAWNTLVSGDIPNNAADTTGTATNATNVATTASSTNATMYPLFVSSSSNGNQGAKLGTGLTFNPSTNVLTTTTFTGALTGTASGNTTYTANNHGVVVSGSGNTMTVIAPDSSTTKVLTSGGSSVDPSWAALPAAYFFGYFDTTKTWARTNTAFGDPTASSATSLNTVQSSNLGTVTQYTTGANTFFPGITFTPTITGRYSIVVKACVEEATSSAFGQVQLYNITSSTALDDGYFRAAAANMSSTITLTGAVSLTASTSVTLTVRTASTSGAVTLTNNGVANNIVSYLVSYIGP
jgi:hypothetical protein